MTSFVRAAGLAASWSQSSRPLPPKYGPDQLNNVVREGQAVTTELGRERFGHHLLGEQIQRLARG